MTIPLADLNAMADADFVAALGPVFAHSPWIAQGAAGARPFATVEALFLAMRAVVEAGPDATRFALLTGHPERGGCLARDGTIAAEPIAAGLDRVSEADDARFEALDAAYRERFGLPFILCIERHGRASLLSASEARLESDAATERRVAEAEMFRIAALRLNRLVVGDGPLRTTGRISTHVLDTVSGRPAAGVAVSLHEVVSETETVLVVSTVTNADGRTDAPLVGGRPVPIAVYELRFSLGDHYRRLGFALPEPPFLDVVPLRFGVSDPEGHYHVPLVATPWSFQTYRGS